MKIKIENVNVYIGKAPLDREQDSPIPVRVVPTVEKIGINTSEEIPEHKIDKKEEARKFAKEIVDELKNQKMERILRNGL